MKHGKVKQEDTAARDSTSAPVKEFFVRFEQRNGTVSCSGLIGYNLSDYGQLKQSRERGGFRTNARAMCVTFLKLRYI